jgi:spore maturation protein CgeB
VDIDITHDIGYNQRMFEVMGVGSFMLTRNAANLSTQFPPNLFETFDTPNECIDKVLFYLDNERERKEMGGRAQEFVLNNHHYRDIVNRFHIDLMKRLSP